VERSWSLIKVGNSNPVFGTIGIFINQQKDKATIEN
jgi:hypothetical protein